jgi:2-keto-4-pentenoate hydratase
MQAYLNIPRPAGGGVFEPTVQHDEGTFRHADFIRPGVECELAVRLSRPLDAARKPFEREEIASAVGSVMAAIEIVDDRYTDWGSLGAPTLIADDFFGAGCVLGTEHEGRHDDVDLQKVSARMTINGTEVGSGVGTDILGDPLTALVWLVNQMAGHGHSLAAGTFVLLGSLVQTHWVEPDDVVAVENVPLGTVTARF